MALLPEFDLCKLFISLSQYGAPVDFHLFSSWVSQAYGFKYEDVEEALYAACWFPSLRLLHYYRCSDNIDLFRRLWSWLVAFYDL